MKSLLLMAMMFMLSVEVAFGNAEAGAGVCERVIVQANRESVPFEARSRANEQGWAQRTTWQMGLAMRQYDTVIIGDSITHGWDQWNGEIRTKYFGDVLNLGIGADRTEHVLWRIRRIKWDVVAPKRIILLIGTNNFGLPPANEPVDVAGAIEQIVMALKKACPQAQILLQAILPRDVNMDRPINAKIMAVNKLLVDVASKWGVMYRDFGGLFLLPDGKTIDRELMPDYLHPNQKGYEVWGKALTEAFEGKLYTTTPQSVKDALAKWQALPRPLRVDRQNMKWAQDWWHQRFLEKLDVAYRQYDVVLIGDSITHAWDTRSAGARDRHFKGCLSLGFSGDCVEMVLWRNRQMPWDVIKPKRIMLMIGTNNIGFAPADKAQTIAAAITQIVDELHVMAPEARIVLLGIFPRDDNKLHPHRQIADAVNAQISTLGQRDYVDYMDLKSLFVQDDENETIRLDLMPDKLHPGVPSYDTWAEAVKEKMVVK